MLFPSLGEQTVMIISLFCLIIWCLDTYMYIVVYTDNNNNFLDFCVWSEATPKVLMRMMGIPGLTLYHLKSHLQALTSLFLYLQWYLQYFDEGALTLKYIGVICCRNIDWGKVTNQRSVMRSTNKVGGIEIRLENWKDWLHLNWFQDFSFCRLQRESEKRCWFPEWGSWWSNPESY